MHGDVVFKRVCFWGVRTKKLLCFPGPQNWRELEKEVSHDVMFNIIIKVESIMVDPFLLSEI